MRTSRKENSAGGVTSGARRACGQTPAMEEGTGAKPGINPGCSVLSSPRLRSLVGEECLQMLRCSVCTEFFSIPIVLPCGHTFCLQCLTDMCKQATRPRVHNAVVTDALICCPNCRVQIFATPILQRNVTCNFIIQSLIDMLRKRKAPRKVDVSVNTERSLIGPPIRAISEEALCGVLQDLDRLSSSLDHQSVVDDAFFEIDRIRSSYLNNRENTSGGGDTLDVRSDKVNSMSDGQSQNCDFASSSRPISQTNSSKTEKSITTKHHQSNDSILIVQNPKRCYAAVLASRKENPTCPVINDSMHSNVKSTRSACGNRPQYNTKTLLVPAIQHGRSSNPSFQNKNRNNSDSAQTNWLSDQSKTANFQSNSWTLPIIRMFPSRAHICQQDWTNTNRQFDQQIEVPIANQLTKSIIHHASMSVKKYHSCLEMTEL